MPFGTGRRKCIGERLSHERLFLFASSIIQNFILLPPTEGVTTRSVRRSTIDDVIDDESPDTSVGDSLCDPRQFNLGLILEPKPFKIRVIRR